MIRAAIITAVVIVGTVVGTADAASTPAPGLATCKHEDGSGQRACVWDARHHGNGKGRSYMVVRWGKGLKHERVIRLTHKQAHAVQR